ncbi:hypothetical protein BDY17DRAFT_300577 [Neohortaea acidophila]|uniref:RING-type domain-containing protein n=1 Tax=Neohortaea acidophila TaxID=245834 RepID=A0A6A6PLP8_9PEZI|nr:uncharacterized protein BDY17DRAFT_300577 [Neohortaea acidophila]KAF2481018.1 hypothetical protein BDY17DRAFT_300577 [Neohortaea acidophila]
MASQQGSRKRVKISRTESVPVLLSTTPKPSTSTATTIMPSNQGGAALAPHELALQTLHSDIDAMRSLVTCKICARMLYEPFALSCGHTYCYSCLSTWLVSNKKKTCPDCRANITQQPTPSYIVRELVLIFLSRNELLPDGETSEEHHTLAREEAKIVADDRANTDPVLGGLFKGCFTGRGARLTPIYDPGDGVERCPECHWELEDGFCDQCGHYMDGVDPSDFSEDDYDEEVDAYYRNMDDLEHSAFGPDGQDDYFGQDDFEGQHSSDSDVIHEVVVRRPRPHEQPVRIMASLSSGISDDSEEEDEEEDDMDGFVVNDDDDVDADGSDDDDAEDNDETPVPQVVSARRLVRRQAAPVVISDDEEEDDSEDEAPVSSGRQRRKRDTTARSAPARTIYSDEESESESSSGGEGGYNHDLENGGGFSPLTGGAGDLDSVQSSYDSEQSVALHNGWPDSEDDGSEPSDSEDDGYSG